MHIEGAAHGEAKRPQIVYAMRVVGVRMAQKDAVEALDLGADQLLAQIGRGVDQHRCRAIGAEALEEHRAAAAAVLRVRRIAGPPPLRDPRHAAGRAAAQNGQSQRQCGDYCLRRLRRLALPPASGSLRKTACVLARVASASASGVIPRASATTAAVETTNAGSLRRPRWGVGAR